MRRSDSSRRPVNCDTCPVARMQTEISEPKRFVDTARREPFGMSFTRLTISNPNPGPIIFENTSSIRPPQPSIPGGIKPAAITAAFNRPA